MRSHHGSVVVRRARDLALQGDEPVEPGHDRRARLPPDVAEQLRAPRQQSPDVELGQPRGDQPPVDEGQASGPVGFEGHVHGREVTVQQGRRAAHGQAAVRGPGVLSQREHPLPHFARGDLGPVLPSSQGVVDDGAARVGPETPWLEEAEEQVERRQSVRRGAEERSMEVGNHSEHGPGLVAADDGLPGENRITEVPHPQHAAAVVVPGVDDRMEHRRGQAVEHATPDELHLPPRRVAGEAHDQIDRRVEVLHHHPGTIRQGDAFQDGARTTVVVERRTVDNASQNLTVHDPMVLAHSTFAQPQS